MSYLLNMPRNPKNRCISGCARSFYFKPQGIPANQLKKIILQEDEFEALRLAELKKLSIRESAERMQISKSTLHRILESAQHKIADAIVNGKAIQIQNFFNLTPNNMPNQDGTGPEGKGPRTGRGMGKCQAKEGEFLPPKRACGRGQNQNQGRGQGRGRSQGRGA